jgi:hypothetical protein
VHVFVQTEDFSEGERGFLNALLVSDAQKRPTLAQLMAAIKGERDDAPPGLQWLAQCGTTADDSNEGFEKEMQRRIKGYNNGTNKNMVAWCVCVRFLLFAVFHCAIEAGRRRRRRGGRGGEGGGGGRGAGGEGGGGGGGGGGEGGG